MQSILFKIRLFLLTALNPLQELISYLAVPETNALGEWVDKAKEVLEAGDILCCYERFHLSNFFIKGLYNHAAIYIGNGMIVEAVPKKVRVIHIIDWVMKKDGFCIIRPVGVPFWERAAAAVAANSFIGLPYDRGFTVGGNALFCSEVCYRAYKDTKWTDIFTKRDVFGVFTILPQDFRDCVAAGKASLILELGTT
jgi:uncharacterized protein YycO